MRDTLFLLCARENGVYLKAAVRDDRQGGKMRLACVLVLAVIFLWPLGAYAQQQGAAANLALAEKQRVTVDDSLIYVALLAGQELDPEAARTFLISRGIIQNTTPLGNVLRRGELASMIMRVKNWGGGLMYSVFGGKRYAWRELVFRRVMPGGGSEYSPVSGDELLLVIGRAAGEVNLRIE